MCMHACKEDSDDITNIHTNSKLKNIITIKPNIQIKFGLYYYLSYDKSFIIRPHTPIFAQFLKKNIFNTK